MSLVLASAGCRSPTEIRVEVRTDIPCDKVVDTAIFVGSASALDSSAREAAHTTYCRDGYIGSLVVVPKGDADTHVGLRVVAGVERPASECERSGYEGCVVARRALSFLRHTPLSLPIALRSSCLNQPCDAATTCVTGTCFPASVPDSSACAESGCDETSLPPASGAPAADRSRGSSSPTGLLHIFA